MANSNFDCSDATLITASLPSSTPIDNRLASSANVTTCTNNSKFVWYKWTATFTGLLQVSTCGTDFLSTVNVYSTTCPDPTTLDGYIACSSSGCQNEYGAVTAFDVTSGTLYYILVSSSHNPGQTTSGTGQLKLSQVDLVLTSVTDIVKSSGGAIVYNLTTSATDDIRANIRYRCGASVQWQDIGQAYTSDTIARASSVGTNSVNSCSLQAYYFPNPSLTSNTVTFNVISSSMSLDSPVTDALIQVGSPFTILVSTAASATLTDVYIVCPYAYEIIQVTSNTAKADAVINDGAFFGSCQFVAESTSGTEVSQGVQVTIRTPLTLTLPQSGENPVNVPLLLLASADEAATGQDIFFDFDCGSAGTFTVNGKANVQTSYTFDSSFIGEFCSIYAKSTGWTYFIDSSSASVSVTEAEYSNTLSLSTSTANPSAGASLSYIASFTPSLVTSLQLKLTCNSVVVQTVTTTSSASAQSFIVASDAIGPCTLQAFSVDTLYPNSNIVDLTVYQQLYISSSLQGWQSGQTVAVNVTSPNLQEFSTVLLTTCSIGSTSGSVLTSTLADYPLQSTLNGVNCLLSTPSVSQPYFLPLLPTFVNIALSPAQQQQVVQQLNPAAMIAALSGVGGAGAGGNNAVQKRFTVKKSQN